MTDLGVIMLDNGLPRPVGDIGNPDSFAYPVAYDVCPGAETALVVERGAAGLLDAVKATAKRLRTRAITTCCGFLAIYQRELAAASDVPVATSSLLQVPIVLQTLKPEQKVCILTVNAFVFECTNLPPYSAAVRAATGLPVWDALTMIDWLRAGVAA